MIAPLQFGKAYKICVPFDREQVVDAEALFADLRLRADEFSKSLNDRGIEAQAGDANSFDKREDGMSLLCRYVYTNEGDEALTVYQKYNALVKEIRAFIFDVPEGTEPNDETQHPKYAEYEKLQQQMTPMNQGADVVEYAPRAGVEIAD